MRTDLLHTDLLRTDIVGGRLVALLLVTLAGLVQLGFYLAAPGGGFPLDDAWIHQTFARGLAQGHGFAYVSGPSVGGSTAPAWTLLLVPGHWIGAPRLWVLLLAWAGAALSALASRWLARELGAGRLADLAGLLGVLEWHIAWSNASGMETGLFAAAVVALAAGALAGQRRGLLGLLGGALVWLRPEGLAFAPLAAALALRRPTSPRQAIRELLPWLPGLVLGAGSWLLFNLSVSGRPLPGTFYAKRAFYTHPDYGEFALGLATLLVLSPFIGLLPGLLGLRGRARCAILWPLALWALYAAVLPLTYQHGRYLLPGLALLGPVLCAGVAALPWSARTKRLYAFGLIVAATIALGYGAQVFAADVRTIEDVQVRIARDLADRAGPTEEIASHDIGALGYFSGHRPVDLAALVDPDVVPLLGDPQALAAHLRERRVRYVVAFEGAYAATLRELGVVPVERVHPEYLQGSVWPAMVVYRVR